MAALVEARRGARAPHPNRVSPELEAKILDYALQYPTHGAQRVANEFRLQNLTVSPSGVRGVWLRHDLETWTKRLLRLERVAQDDTVILSATQIQAFNELYNRSASKKPRYEIRIGSGPEATQPLPNLLKSPVPGDIMTFANPNVRAGLEQWGNENVVLLSTNGDRYYGHGIGIEGKATILQDLNGKASKRDASLLPQAKQVHWENLYYQVHRR